MCELRSLREGSKANLDPNNIFFSLVDYRINLFTSKKSSDILHFYGSFHTKEELIEWMKERPEGRTTYS